MASARLTAAQLGRSPVMWLAAGFGAGLSPRGPGTAGTVVGLLLAMLLDVAPPPVFWAATALAVLAGSWICGTAARRLGVHDHGGIVWDEIAGLWLAMLFLPHNLAGYALGFILFRFFDIAKPWPICWLDRRVHGGIGIMLDDLLAGLAAAGAGWMIIWVVGM